MPLKIDKYYKAVVAAIIIFALLIPFSVYLSKKFYSQVSVSIQILLFGVNLFLVTLVFIETKITYENLDKSWKTTTWNYLVSRLGEILASLSSLYLLAENKCNRDQDCVCLPHIKSQKYYHDYITKISWIHSPSQITEAVCLPSPTDALLYLKTIALTLENTKLIKIIDSIDLDKKDQLKDKIYQIIHEFEELTGYYLNKRLCKEVINLNKKGFTYC